MKLHIRAALFVALFSSNVFAADAAPVTAGAILPPPGAEEQAGNDLPRAVALPSFVSSGADSKAPAMPELTVPLPPAGADAAPLPDTAQVSGKQPSPGDTLTLPATPAVPHDEAFPVHPDAQKPTLALVDSLFGEKKQPDTKVAIEDASKTDGKTKTTETSPETAVDAGATETAAADATDKKDPAAKPKKKHASRRGAQGNGFAYRTQILPDTIYMREYPRGNRFLPKAQYEQEWDRLMFVTASANNLNGLRSLLETGRAPDLRDALGQTPLIVAIRYKSMNTARLLLARGANPNAMDNAGNSAMHYAVASNDYALVRALIEMGGRADLADSRGVTPVMLAEQGRNPLIISAIGM